MNQPRALPQGLPRLVEEAESHLSSATEVWEIGSTEAVVTLEESGRASLGRWCLNWALKDFAKLRSRQGSSKSTACPQSTL